VNRQIRRLGLAFLVLFLILFAQVNYLQVFAADRLANNPANHRLLLQEFDVQRGAILARDGRTVLATSVETTGDLRFLRTYPRGRLWGQETGYYAVQYGRSALEQAFNDYLAGRAEELLPQNLVDEILGRPKRGGTVVTTLDPQLQQVAQAQLADLPGAVVAMDPRTGEVLAMYANPNYDPNDLATHDLAEATRAWKELNADPEKPLLSRARQELFPPGSTFKLVTAAAALENGYKPSTTIPNPPSYTPPQTTNPIENFGGTQCAGGAPEITLATALTVSCNVAFAQIGVDLGPEALVNQAEAFGFNRDVPFDIAFSEGQIPPAEAFEFDTPGLALSAIGQKDVRANPLQMALVGAAIANGGVEMAPRLVNEVRDPSGRVVRTLGDDEFGRPISPQTAAQLTAMMVDVVQSGTGTAAQINGVTVAGKTGTAQHAGGDPHAWFVGFAPAQNPTIVVAVIVLDGGSLGSEATGGRIAAPIARAVMQAALAESGP
jgi:peptidoglycan glycosyltransferase